ncbi:hypothetical protein EV175_002458 [Coemansia sp. RSA 1933]|nr:hypothetical protein EV175_002458 [Coemansia sp. RSA 1933]
MTGALVAVDKFMLSRRRPAVQNLEGLMEYVSATTAGQANVEHMAADLADPVRANTQTPPEASAIEHDDASSASTAGIDSNDSTARTTTTTTTTSGIGRADRPRYAGETTAAAAPSGTLPRFQPAPAPQLPRSQLTAAELAAMPSVLAMVVRYETQETSGITTAA